MKNIKTVLLSGTALLLLAACGTEDTQQQETPNDTQDSTEQVEETETDQTEQTTETESEETTDSTNTDENTSQGIENREFDYTLDDAVQIFFDTFPEAESINKVEFDVDDGRFEYEIDGFNAGTEFELTLDAESGEVLQQNSEADDDNDETAINFDQMISPQEAMEIALEDARTGYVREWELEADDGRTEYDIDIEGADDRDIDAETGEVVDR